MSFFVDPFFSIPKSPKILYKTAALPLDVSLRRATLYPAELWVHDAGRTWRLAKAMGLRQPQFTRALSYFAAFSIGWNLPRPQLAPGCRPGPLFHNTVMISTEQSCEMLVW